MADYYSTLNISKNASKVEIKKAYRKLAVKLHPDKNPSPEAGEKFKAVSEAYTVLSDPEQRAAYDRHGRAGLENGGAGFDPSEIFQNFFGNSGFSFGGHGFPFGGGQGHNQVKRKGPNKQVQISVSLQEMFNGSKRQFAINQKSKCVGCDASGLKRSASAKKCPTCGGQGKVIIRQSMRGGISQAITTCTACSGKGVFISNTDKCSTCTGTKYKTVKKIVSVEIPVGIMEGESIILENLSDEGVGWREPGDLIFVIKQKESSKMTRDNLNLIVSSKITLVQALVGLNMEFKHPRGNSIRVSFDEVIKPNKNYKVFEQGFTKNGRTGDLIFKFEIDFPDTLDSKRKEVISKIFPKQSYTPTPNIKDYNLVYVGDYHTSEHIPEKPEIPREQMPGECAQQ